MVRVHKCLFIIYLLLGFVVPILVRCTLGEVGMSVVQKDIATTLMFGGMIVLIRVSIALWRRTTMKWGVRYVVGSRQAAVAGLFATPVVALLTWWLLAICPGMDSKWIGGAHSVGLASAWYVYSISSAMLFGLAAWHFLCYMGSQTLDA